MNHIPTPPVHIRYYRYLIILCPPRGGPRAPWKCSCSRNCSASILRGNPAEALFDQLSDLDDCVFLVVLSMFLVGGWIIAMLMPTAVSHKSQSDLPVRIPEMFPRGSFHSFFCPSEKHIMDMDESLSVSICGSEQFWVDQLIEYRVPTNARCKTWWNY